MGKRSRSRPERIGEKLRQIRNALGLSQNQLTHHLLLPKEFKRSIISNYENDEREPPLFVLLAYARVAGICLEVIVDDAIDVPPKLPVTPAHRAIEINRAKRTVR